MKCKKYYRDMEKFNAYKKRSVSRYRETTRFYGIGTKYSRYTEDEEKIILDRGYTDREIAKLLKRSVNAIQKKRHTLTHDQSRSI